MLATLIRILTWYVVCSYNYIPKVLHCTYILYSSQTNTFQCIIISDGTHTFVTFLYNDIQWTTGDASGGTGGFGGTPAQVGFNAGDGTFFSLQGSQTAAIVDIEGTTNVGVPGQYTFRVDEAEIVSPRTFFKTVQ